MISAEGLIKLGFTPEVDFSIWNDGDGPYIHDWNSSSPQPSEAEIEAAHNEWQAEYDSTEYQRLRAPEYPPIGDQLDALFHAGVFPADMAAQLQAVKDKYPNG
tara:strand:- start:132 stop:440 length:309 start_codon:yes stop_codon:yes gene_type:complete